ncbi:MAG: glycosyltransferase [Solirubrobacteraceae bacterium]
MPAPMIDVLIATRTRDMILGCLGDLGAQTAAHRIFVADNGGNADGTSDAIRAQFPEVEVLTLERNLGFGAAMNRLAAMGSAELIVLVNDDVTLEPQFLQALSGPLADAGVGMVAGLTLQPVGGEVVDGFGIEADPTLTAYNRLRHQSPDATPGRLLGPSGAAAAYRRTAFEAACGFDTRLFVYAEDLDLALRLRNAGWRAAAAPHARAVHLGGATAGMDSAFQRRHAAFGRGFILRRYGVLRTRHAPRALGLEALTVLFGILRSRSAVPLGARIAGWRAAGTGPRLPIPGGAVDTQISAREALRRQRFER